MCLYGVGLCSGRRLCYSSLCSSAFDVVAMQCHAIINIKCNHIVNGSFDDVFQEMGKKYMLNGVCCAVRGSFGSTWIVI